MMMLMVMMEYSDMTSEPFGEVILNLLGFLGRIPLFFNKFICQQKISESGTSVHAGVSSEGTGGETGLFSNNPDATESRHDHPVAMILSRYTTVYLSTWLPIFVVDEACTNNAPIILDLKGRFFPPMHYRLHQRKAYGKIGCCLNDDAGCQ